MSAQVSVMDGNGRRYRIKFSKARQLIESKQAEWLDTARTRLQVVHFDLRGQSCKPGQRIIEQSAVGAQFAHDIIDCYGPLQLADAQRYDVVDAQTIVLLETNHSKR